jgi:hypothetical protein
VNLPPKKAISYTSDSYADPLGTAIAEAEPGETLQVTGVCHGNWYLDKDLTITGQSRNSDTLVGEPTSISPVLEAGWGESGGYDLVLKHLTITGGQGGVRASNDSTLSVIDSVITNNHAGYRGGGIDTSGSLTVVDSIVSNNNGNSKHGGIAVYGGGATLINTVVTGNTAGRNGGIGNMGYHATLTLINSTISNNVATNTLVEGANFGDYGGGIWNNNGQVDLINSTVVGNSNLGLPTPDWWPYPAVLGHGGGIVNGGVVTLTHSFVTGNIAFSGGGIYNDQQGTVVLKAGSLVYGNSPDDIAP